MKRPLRIPFLSLLLGGVAISGCSSVPPETTPSPSPDIGTETPNTPPSTPTPAATPMPTFAETGTPEAPESPTPSPTPTPTPTPSTAPVVAARFFMDADQDGYGDAAQEVLAAAPAPGLAPVPGDCDDADASRNPLAPEQCDGIDQDCDGALDNGPWYADLDGDGFGDDASLSLPCSATAVVNTRGDCDDAQPDVHPGAEDSSGDTLDSDCGGTDGTDPHVGYQAHSWPTLAAAIAAASPGQTIWVGPGHYLEHHLSFSGLDLTLRSSHFAARTIIDGEDAERIFQAVEGESTAARVDGFSLVRGTDPAGGGALFISGSGLTLANMRVTANRTEVDSAAGAAVLVEEGELTVSDSRFSNNLSGACSTLTDAAPDFNQPEKQLRCSLANGGAVAADTSILQLTRVSFDGNQAVGDGGALYLKNSDTELEDTRFEANQTLSGCEKTWTSTSINPIVTVCPGSGEGGALAVSGGTLSGSDVLFDHNQTAEECVENKQLTGDPYYYYSNCSFYTLECQRRPGGAGRFDQTSVSLTGVTASHNVAGDGGALAISNSTLELQDGAFDSNSANAKSYTSDSEASYYDDSERYYSTQTTDSAGLPGRGGALYLNATEASLLDTRFTSNQSLGDGGDLAQLGGSLTLRRVSSQGARSIIGQTSLNTLNCYRYDPGVCSDGIYTCESSSETHRSVSAMGGSMFLISNTYSADELVLEQPGAYTGGGIYAQDARGSMVRSRLAGAQSVDPGGALLVMNGSLELSNSTFVHSLTTDAASTGAAMRLDNVAAQLSHLTIVGNQSPGTTGGVVLSGGVTSIDNSIIAFNSGLGLSFEYGAFADVHFTDLYHPTHAAHALEDLPADNFEVDPVFVGYARGREAPDAELLLRAESPLINAGAEAERDLDGSRADLGAFGGPQAAPAAQDDADHDGMPTLWEQDNALDEARANADEDPDQDGLSNLLEWQHGCNPHESDSDGDAALDGAEVSVGSDPLHPGSVPGSNGYEALEVPGDYPSLAAALAKLPGFGSIALAVGTYAGGIVLNDGEYTLRGAGEGVSIIEAVGQHNLTATNASLKLQDLTLKGSGQVALLQLTSSTGMLERVHVGPGSGKGVQLTDGQLTLKESTVSNNVQGLWLVDSIATLEGCRIENNTTAQQGGGIGAFNTLLSLTDTQLMQNTSTQQGGGLYVNQGQVSLQGVRIEGNSSAQSGGAYIGNAEVSGEDIYISGNEAHPSCSTSTSGCYSYTSCSDANNGGLLLANVSGALDQVQITDNIVFTALDDGGSTSGSSAGLGLGNATVRLSHVALVGNMIDLGPYGNGFATALNIGGGYPTITYLNISGNSATAGASDSVATTIELSGTAARIEHAVVSGNMRDVLLLASAPITLKASNSASAWLSESIFAYNTGMNLTIPAGDNSLLSNLRYNDFYAAPGQPNYSMSTLPSTNLEVEPQFLSYDANGIPEDVHLSAMSPLINQGDPGALDADGTRSDLGLYGGAGGDEWDLDGDGLPTWYWPGAYTGAPVGVDASAYDCDP